jgi:hypothetical protein
MSAAQGEFPLSISRGLNCAHTSISTVLALLSVSRFTYGLSGVDPSYGRFCESLQRKSYGIVTLTVRCCTELGSSLGEELHPPAFPYIEKPVTPFGTISNEGLFQSCRFGEAKHNFFRHRYDYLPYFYSRVFEHPGSERKVWWQFYGDNSESSPATLSSPSE